jgi:APA family basic amino acid/polyamine antiporter
LSSLRTSAYAVSTAAEETRDPQRNLPIGILGGLAICTVIYVLVGAVLTGVVRYDQLAVADSLARALELAGYSGVGWLVALGAVVSMSAVLLVFQYGQPRIFLPWHAMGFCRRGRLASIVEPGSRT